MWEIARSLDEGALLDVDHAGVEDLLVDLEVVDQAEAANHPMADQLAGDLPELNLHDHVVGAFVVRDRSGRATSQRR